MQELRVGYFLIFFFRVSFPFFSLSFSLFLYILKWRIGSQGMDTRSGLIRDETSSFCVVNHTGLWLRTGCVTNAQVSVFERTGF